jgi:predicted outer membrane protein
MIGDGRPIRKLLRVLVLSAVTLLTVAGPIAPAQAHIHDLGADTAPYPSGGTQDAGGAVSLDTQEAPLTAADRDLIVKVRLAGLWEGRAGRMAAKKGASPRVRQIGVMIANQHRQLDALDEAAAKELGVKLPTEPSGEQQRWLGEMKDASGPAFDAIFVQRLRAAHGKIFPAIAVVRAGTQNEVVRKLAQQANAFVLTHLTLLESTTLVRYEELPHPVAPATGPIAAATRRSATGGIAVPLIWLILAVALVTGMVATARLVRPSSFGGRHTGAGRTQPEASQPVAVTGPIPVDSLYPRPRMRNSSRSIS